MEPLRYALLVEWDELNAIRVTTRGVSQPVALGILTLLVEQLRAQLVAELVRKGVQTGIVLAGTMPDGR